jgi:hypothetical protein
VRSPWIQGDTVLTPSQGTTLQLGIRLRNQAEDNVMQTVSRTLKEEVTLNLPPQSWRSATPSMLIVQWRPQN